MSGNADLKKDLELIRRLHEKDMAASKAGDFETLRSLMTDDAVMMPPGESWIRGRAELDASFNRTKDAMRQVEVLDYVLDFEEVKILGDYAFEWGTVRGAMRSRNDGEVEYATYKVMRILHKHSDGEWKVHRSIWNENPT
jgi:uncharacterized protein (TIGR02246 family)